MRMTRINLTHHHLRFIEQGVRRGRFQSVTAAISEGLKLLRDRQREDTRKLKALRRAIEQLFDETDHRQYVEIGPEEIDQFMDEMDARVRAATKRRGSR